MWKIQVENRENENKLPTNSPLTIECISSGFGSRYNF